MVAFHEQLHDQEHLWEAEKYGKLEDWWDEANRDMWDLHHKFLKRIYKLGGQPPDVTDNELDAYKRALNGFKALHSECQRLYELTEAEDYDEDYVTQKMLMKVQKELESWIAETEARIKQVKRLGDTFMGEQM